MRATRAYPTNEDSTGAGVALIDLGIGHVNNSVLPLAELKRILRTLLEEVQPSCLQYAAEQGSGSLRSVLSGYLTRHTGSPIPPETVVVTTGASHGLDLVLNKLGQPRDTIFVEDPTYFYALDIFRDRDLHIVPVATDEQGLVVSDLEEALRHHHPRFLYLIPTYHNPTGRTLPLERRRAIVELAEQHDFLVVSDDAYQLLDPNTMMAPLFDYQSPHTISLGTLSKVFGPGLRIGWVLTASTHLPQLLDCGVLRSGGGANPFTAAVAETAIRTGVLDRCLDGLRDFYLRRAGLMTALLQQSLPSSARFQPPTGGYFVWLEAPAAADLAALRSEARAAGVDFKPGSQFSWAGNFRNCARLCFTYYDEKQLTDACIRLGEILA